MAHETEKFLPVPIKHGNHHQFQFLVERLNISRSTVTALSVVMVGFAYGPARASFDPTFEPPAVRGC